jgi:hypothetical protein
VQEEDVLARLEVAPANQPDQPGHGLAGVDRIEQHALVAGQQAHRFDHFGRRQGVAGPHPFIEAGDGVARNSALEAERSGGGAGQGVDVGLLLRTPPADVDAGDRDPGVASDQADQ